MDSYDGLSRSYLAGSTELARALICWLGPGLESEPNCTIIKIQPNCGRLRWYPSAVAAEKEAYMRLRRLAYVFVGFLIVTSASAQFDENSPGVDIDYYSDSG